MRLPSIMVLLLLCFAPAIAVAGAFPSPTLGPLYTGPNYRPMTAAELAAGAARMRQQAEERRRQDQIRIFGIAGGLLVASAGVLLFLRFRARMGSAAENAIVGPLVIAAKG